MALCYIDDQPSWMYYYKYCAILAEFTTRFLPPINLSFLMAKFYFLSLQLAEIVRRFEAEATGKRPQSLQQRPGKNDIFSSIRVR